MINRRHDDRASSRARHSLNSRLKKSHEFTRLLLEKADMRVGLIAAWRSTQGMKDTAFEAAAGEFGKEPFDRVEPRGRGRDEMERPARVPGEPSAHFGMLVAGVIVEDHVDQPAGRDVVFETVQEAEKLLVPMAAAYTGRSPCRRVH
jgi:hypothetical protein